MVALFTDIAGSNRLRTPPRHGALPLRGLFPPFQGHFAQLLALAKDHGAGPNLVHNKMPQSITAARKERGRHRQLG